ncbi:hypothetical protein NPIL_73161 [Nephila pilipes]|uniref:Uncharacterized protein n=1 Tax=Nephila pilipes TaxID=299642 RepID=A0A8X6MRK1_NEPPI|nr:hypothetical protein NPIL_73161 [Nephila pilipes]
MSPVRKILCTIYQVLRIHLQLPLQKSLVTFSNKAVSRRTKIYSLLFHGVDTLFFVFPLCEFARGTYQNRLRDSERESGGIRINPESGARSKASDLERVVFFKDS